MEGKTVWKEEHLEMISMLTEWVTYRRTDEHWNYETWRLKGWETVKTLLLELDWQGDSWAQGMWGKQDSFQISFLG